MDGKVLTDETLDMVVVFIYAKIKNKIPGWLKIFNIAKLGIKIALNFLMKYGDKVIPDEIDIYINEAVKQFNAGQTEAAIAAIANAENKLIDIKHVDETSEYQLMYANTYALVINIKAWIEGDKGSVE